MDITTIKNLLNVIAEQFSETNGMKDKLLFTQRHNNLRNNRDDYVSILPNNTLIGCITINEIRNKFLTMMNERGWESDKLSCGEFVVRKKSKYYEGYLKNKLKNEINDYVDTGYRVNIKRSSW